MEKQITQIRVPDWMKREKPSTAEFCELINFALQGNPNMSLAEFAKTLDEENVRATYERIVAAEKAQFEEVKK